MEQPPPIPPKEPTPDRGASSPPRRGQLTGAGCVLALITILATIGAGVVFPFWIYPRFLPPGVYPRVLLVLPIVFVGIGVAVAATWLMKKLRIPITKNPDDDSNAT